MDKDQQNNQKSITNKVMASSMKLAAATFSSRILGLVREQALAAVFGASGITDAFNVAYRIPNMLRDLFAEGAFSPAFVPVFTEAKKEGHEVARKLLWSVFYLLLILTGVICILMMIFAPEIVSKMAPKFLEVPKKFEITVTLLRIMAPFLSLISIAALFMGTLNTFKIFFVPALAPAFFNVVMIISIIFVPPILKQNGVEGVYALGMGVIFGGLLQILVQVPLIIKNALSPTGQVTLISVYTKKILGRMGIGTIGMVGSQVNIFINTLLATGTVVGAVSWLNFAFRLLQFPLGILGVSIGGSNLVHFSDAWKSGKEKEAKTLLKSSYMLSLFTISWALTMLFAMSTPTIHLIFERGAFTWEDTVITSELLRYYLWGLPAYGLYKIFAPTFYSIDKPKIPVFISLFSILVNIVFCVSLVPVYSFKILAMGVSLSITVNAILQMIFLTKYLKLSSLFFFDLRILKIIIASFVTGLITYFLVFKFFNFAYIFIVKIALFVAIGLLGSFCYGLLLYALGEGKSLKKIIRRKK